MVGKARQQATSTFQTTPAEAGCRVYAPRKFNPRSKQRFAADRTAELTRHLGRSPTYPERLLIGRIIAIEWDLRRLDARADAGEELSGHALRARLAAETRLRLDLNCLKPAAPAKPPSLADLAWPLPAPARGAAA